MKWVYCDDNWDSCSGGAIAFSYARRDDPSNDLFMAAGVTWLDGGDDGKHYFACIAAFERYEDVDGVMVECGWDALDAYLYITDRDVACDLGMYYTIDDARTAVEHVLWLMEGDDCA